MIHDNNPDVIVIGAGLAGLAATLQLQDLGYEVLLLEKSERIGGRLKTDWINGYLFDHGFQVLLTAYPETQSILDYEQLNLCKFKPGSYIFKKSQRHYLGDPLRDLSSLPGSLFSRITTLKDKIKILKLSRSLKKKSLDEIFKEKEISTYQVLISYGFSEKVIENFFKPFMSGIFLEDELFTSRRVFDFVFKMFAEGYAAIPEYGMEMIPRQLASRIHPQRILTHKNVVSIDSKKVVLESGEEFESEKILIATEAAELPSRYLGENLNIKFESTTCFYFSANKSPLSRPALALNASQNKLVNNFCVISDISSRYAPTGKSLISVSINDFIDQPKEEETVEKIRLELRRFLGDEVEQWKFLKSYPVRYALPVQEKVELSHEQSHFKINDNLFICGDHMLNGSINSAISSGKIAARAIYESMI